MTLSTLLHIVADYGVGEPAFSEVAQRFFALGTNLTILPTSVPKFNTLATGFWIYQLALGEHPDSMLIFSNTAPRHDDVQVRHDNEGERLLYAKLDNQVEILAVNSGFSFAFIKPHIQDFRTVLVQNHGSQFRSRDFYPQAVIDVLDHKPAILGGELSLDLAPDVPPQRIAWVDAYGNLKTTLRRSQVAFKPGDMVELQIGSKVQPLRVSDGMFEIAQGEWTFSPGSSGYGDPFMEISLRGASAYAELGSPAWSEALELTLSSDGGTGLGK